MSRYDDSNEPGWMDVWRISFRAVPPQDIPVWEQELREAFSASPTTRKELVGAIRYMARRKEWRKHPGVGELIHQINELRGNMPAAKMGCGTCTDGWILYCDHGQWLDSDPLLRGHQWHIPCDCARGKNWLQTYADKYQDRAMWAKLAVLAREQLAPIEAA